MKDNSYWFLPVLISIIILVGIAQWAIQTGDLITLIIVSIVMLLILALYYKNED